MILAPFQRPCGSLKLRQIEEREHVQTDRECELDAAAAETHGIDTQAEHARRAAAAQEQRTCTVTKNIEKRKKPAQGTRNHS